MLGLAGTDILNIKLQAATQWLHVASPSKLLFSVPIKVFTFSNQTLIKQQLLELEISKTIKMASDVDVEKDKR